jgi:copper(I)-binding protein
MRLLPVAFALAAALSIGGCTGKPAAALRADDAWVRLPAVAGRPAAAYFVLHGGPAADRLTGIATPAAARAELHEGGMMNGMSMMKPMSGVDLPADGRVAFAPGGNHVMLFSVDPAIRPGSTMPLRLRFGSGATLETAARVISAGDPAPSPEQD